MVEFINASGWAVILWKNGEAYVQGRFLVDDKPGPRPTPSQQSEEEKEMKVEMNKLNNELKSEKDVAEPFMVAVRATRTTGWINFRVGPGKITTRIASFPDGKQLRVIGETTNWYKATDLETGKNGYIHKSYVTKIATPITLKKPAGKEALGSLTVNGEFDLQCKLPEGYNIQVVNMRGSKIVATIQSADILKPVLYLSIAFDETYSDVERLNDLNDEALAVLEESFRTMNDVEISYRETGYGTKLLIAREVGNDTDFVDILSIYKGYFVEFNMTPSPSAGGITLTEEQIRMCIDFLTDLDFVPVQK